MATGISTSSAIFTEAPASRVYFRVLWTDEWEEVPYLYWHQITWSAAPAMHHATLEWRFGVGQRAGEGTFADVHQIELLEKFVKIEIDAGADPSIQPAQTWFGIVVIEDPQRDGQQPSVSVGDPPVRTGMQTFQAVGLEWLFDRVPINSSVVENHDTTKFKPNGESGQDEFTIGRALTFNDYHGHKRFAREVRGNRSAARGDGGAYIFAKDFDGAEKWSLADIVDYLLVYYGPKDSEGEALFEFVPLTTDYLTWHKPVFSVDGMTLWQALNQIIDRRRGFGFYLYVDPSSEQLELRVFGFNKDEINLEPEAESSAPTIPANENLRSFDFETALDVQVAKTVYDANSTYRQILVRGARKTSTFTLSWKDGTLRDDWRPEDETAYDVAASDQPGYAALKQSERRLRNHRVRSEEKLARVYSWFRIPKDWDGKVKDGNGAGTAKPVFPELDASGNPTNESEPFWLAGLQLLSQLPLLLDHDYSEDVTDPENLAPERSEPEQSPALVFVKVQTKYNEGTPSTWKYQRGDALVATSFEAKHSQNSWSLSCRPRATGPGLIVTVSGGPQHRIAKGVFDDIDARDEQPEIDYRDNLLVTVCAESDRHVEAIHPDTFEGLNPDSLERPLLIDVPDARLDYVVPETVLSLDDQGDLERTTAGGFLRDDRPRLKNIAQLAFEWYSVPRAAFEFRVQQLIRPVELGHLITEIGPAGDTDPVNTPITSITLDLPARATTLTTSFSELDFAGLIT